MFPVAVIFVELAPRTWMPTLLLMTVFPMISLDPESAITMPSERLSATELFSIVLPEDSSSIMIPFRPLPLVMLLRTIPPVT